MLWHNLKCKVKTGDNQPEPLEYVQFPALYRAADTYSLSQQRMFFRLLGAQLLLLLIAAVISVLNSTLPSLAILQAVSLFGALACATYLFTMKPDRHWYASRAVAESVKTVTWRYVTRAEPFNVNDAMSKVHFAKTLHAIVGQNQDVAQRFSTDLDGTQMTDRMEGLRSAGFDERKSAYLEGRVVEQQKWYARKNKMNHILAKRAFAALVIFLALAGILAICRVRYPQASFWPTDVFVTLAATMLAWMQSKRFSELAAAYSLAAVEISNVRLQGESVTDDETLSVFVGDAENAFSREHTQWVARKDS